MKVSKLLAITIEGTPRKRKELERVIRKLLEGYEGKRGVYNITVGEINK